MGMFDTVSIEIKCPYCGKESKRDCQTKDLDCMLELWVKGDNVGTSKYNSLDCIADCGAKECKDYTIKRHGYWGGFGRMFSVEVFLNNGAVTGEYKITSYDDDRLQ